ncbi:hypothetical protein [Kribbella sp. NBC_00359]|uniref:hypothetical protein n=1 Tax=Kribbella sp. NBC_00359 TaxID=2975966 RepID=UPI002E245412
MTNRQSLQPPFEAADLPLCRNNLLASPLDLAMAVTGSFGLGIGGQVASQYGREHLLAPGKPCAFSLTVDLCAEQQIARRGVQDGPFGISRHRLIADEPFVCVIGQPWPADLNLDPGSWFRIRAPA